MNMKYTKALAYGFMLSVSGLYAAEEQAALTAMKPTAAPEWRLVEPAKDAKAASAVLMDKGAGNDKLMVKMASASDQNNVWCVANDGSKDAVYQPTSRGLVKKFDGVFVAAGKEIVTAINDKQEVFELEGGTGDDWKKIEGLKLSRVSRPNHKVGWGLLETGKGAFASYMYDDEENQWLPVKNLQGLDAKGIIDFSANEEEAILALTDDGELLKRDVTRVQMHEKVKAVIEKDKKEGKKAKKDKKGKGKKDKKADAAMIDADGDGKPDAEEQDHKKGKKAKKDKKGKGKKDKKADAAMIDADGDGKPDAEEQDHKEGKEAKKKKKAKQAE